MANVQVFPESSLTKALMDFWDEQMGKGDESPLDDIFSLGSEMDSLTAVIVLNVVAEILPTVPLKESLVKKGGYQSKEDFVTHMRTGIYKQAQQCGYQ